MVQDQPVFKKVIQLKLWHGLIVYRWVIYFSYLLLVWSHARLLGDSFLSVLGLGVRLQSAINWLVFKQ